jgi:hypothetical protein
MYKHRKRDKRKAVIRERLLFGPHTCRIGLCGRDGTCGVDLPGIRFGYTGTHPNGEEHEVWTRIYLCELHAKEETEK